MEYQLLVTIGIFILTQVIVSVWWASKVNTILGIVQTDLKDLITELKSMKENYVTTSEFAQHKVPCKTQIDALWKKVDGLT